MQTHPTYIPIITSLRGLAATAICFYHFVLSTVDYIEDEMLRNIFYYAQYGVPMFFVISGVVLPLTMLKHDYQLQKLPQFILKRLVRLEPPYLVSLILATGYLFFQAYRHGGELAVSWYNFLLHLGYLIPFVEGQSWMNPIYWSLAVEFQYYLFLSVAFVALKHPHIGWRLLVYGLMFFASFITNEKAFICRWLPLFLVGIVYVLYQYQRIKIVEYSIVSLGCLFLVQYLLGTPNMVMAVVTLMAIHYYPNFNNRWTNWVGEISYSLYLLHLLVGQALVNYLSHSFRQPYEKVLVILLGYAVSLFAAWVLYKLVEQPSKRAAKKIRAT